MTHRFSLSAILLLMLMPLNVMAQPSVTITAPISDIEVVEGDEFFSDVLNDPIDFDKRRDIRWEENWDDSSITVSNGQWSGTTGNHETYVYAHFHGFNNPSNSPANIGKLGANFPIDTSKYNGFSVLSAISSLDDGARKVLRWTRDLTNPKLDNTGFFVDWIDAFIAPGDGGTTNTKIIYHGGGEMILDIRDLSGNADWTGANITGLIYDQRINAAAGVSESYRMMRVFDPDSAPLLTIRWDYSELPITGIEPRVNIYVDTDNVGFDGFFMARVPVNNGTASGVANGTGEYTFQTAALPPGTYYFYVRVMDAFEDTDDQVAISGYSAALTVNAKTRITFQNPSYTSGEDYATAVLGNPWDFDDEIDVSNLNFEESLKQYKDHEFTIDGSFKATAYIPAANRPGQTETDAQVWLNTDFGNPVTPIDTAKYRYLTYEISLDPTGYTTISDKVARGWVVRLVWWKEGTAIDGTVTGDIFTYEGIHSYSVDLKNVTLAPATPQLPQPGWTEIGQAKIFRFDPCETDPDTIFFLHDVKLTANPEPDYTTNTFDIAYTTTDQENDIAVVEFYRDDNNSGFNGTLIGSESNVMPGTNTYSFSTADLPQADYHIYAVVTDAFGNVTQSYADVPLSVSQGAITGNLIPRYRLYNPFEFKHHYTTDLNEYNVLSTLGWNQEGIAYFVYDAAVTVDSVQAVAFFRLYNPNTGKHHWTTDANENNVLGSIGWTQEGIDGYIFMSQVTDSVALYRLYNPFSFKHLWTTDLNERNVLIGLGWNDEGIAGYVFNSAN